MHSLSCEAAHVGHLLNAAMGETVCMCFDALDLLTKAHKAESLSHKDLDLQEGVEVVILFW